MRGKEGEGRRGGGADRNRRFLAKAIRCRPIGLARGTTTTAIVVEHYEHAVSHEIASLADSIASIGDIGCC